MKRRGFLGFLGAAIAGATLDPEKLLWEPGKKFISIPKPLSSYDSAVQFYIRAIMEFGNSPRFNAKIDGIEPSRDWFRMEVDPIHYMEFKDFVIQ